MKTEDRIKLQRQLVEEIGIYFDKQGFQRTAGRILGLLMIMDKEQYTFEEITEELGISKSSASIALKNLELRGNIEYVTYPGDRKRYFRMKTLDPFAIIDDFAQRMVAFKMMQEKILGLKADPNSRNSKFFRDLNKMMEFFLDNIDEMKTEYNKTLNNTD